MEGGNYRQEGECPRAARAFQGSPVPAFQALCGSGAEVTGVELSLSLAQGTSVRAEGDLRPWQPWPEQKLELAASARTQWRHVQNCPQCWGEAGLSVHLAFSTFEFVSQCSNSIK